MCLFVILIYVMGEWVNEWVSEWASEWVSEWVSEWMSVCVYMFIHENPIFTLFEGECKYY